MTMLKQWVLQVRYPYTAGVLTVMWLGSGTVMLLAPQIYPELLLTLLAFATVFVAYIGFSSRRS